MSLMALQMWLHMRSERFWVRFPSAFAALAFLYHAFYHYAWLCLLSPVPCVALIVIAFLTVPVLASL